MAYGIKYKETEFYYWCDAHLGFMLEDIEYAKLFYTKERAKEEFEEYFEDDDVLNVDGFGDTTKEDYSIVEVDNK